jgi:two-component system, OmpR family, sensor histidine kinase TctE
MGARQGDADLVLPRATVQRLEQATRRAATLTHQLLTLSRAEDAAASPAMETVLLQDVIHEVLALRLDEAHARQADLGTDVAQDAQQAYVLAQPWMLKELLLNLVDNALRYASAPAVVTIGAKRISDQAVEAYVADNGPGIPEAERDLVLERFYRAKGNLVDGNGLGLAIAQEIAERHGARLVLRDAQPDAKSPGLWIGLALPLASRANPAPGDELAVRK